MPLTRVMLEQALQSLERRRPIFHSEADFQHELAIELFKKYSLNIRLEKPFRVDENQKFEIDIIVSDGLSKYGIELKYKTTDVEANVGDETFMIKEHSATPLARYDFLKDLSRLEILKNSEIEAGFAIFLTNAKLYWKNSRKDAGNGHAFLISEGSIKSGSMGWRNSENQNSIGASRVSSIELNGSYQCSWQDYSLVEDNLFKYLIVQV